MLKETAMSTLMEDDIKRWTAKRKTALVLDIIQGKTTVPEASRTHDLNASEVKQWVDDGKKGMENALTHAPSPWKSKSSASASSVTCSRPKAKPCWSCVPEKSWLPCWATRSKNDPQPSAGIFTRRIQCQPWGAISQKTAFWRASCRTRGVRLIQTPVCMMPLAFPVLRGG